MKQFLRSFLPRKIDTPTPAVAPVSTLPADEPLRRARLQLSADLGDERAAETIARVKVFAAAPPVDAIERLGAGRFADFLSAEHPEAAALFVAALPKKLQAKVVDELALPLREEVRDRIDR